MSTYDDIFTAQLDALKAEGNYRIFADLDRRTGSYPRAYNRQAGHEREVTG